MSKTIISRYFRCFIISGIGDKNDPQKLPVDNFVYVLLIFGKCPINITIEEV